MCANFHGFNFRANACPWKLVPSENFCTYGTFLTFFHLCLVSILFSSTSLLGVKFCTNLSPSLIWNQPLTNHDLNLVHCLLSSRITALSRNKAPSPIASKSYSSPFDRIPSLTPYAISTSKNGLILNLLLIYPLCSSRASISFAQTTWLCIKMKDLLWGKPLKKDLPSLRALLQQMKTSLSPLYLSMLRLPYRKHCRCSHSWSSFVYMHCSFKDKLKPWHREG